MARICGVCKTEKMFTITRGDKIICVECHNKEALSPQTEQAEASSLSDGLALKGCEWSYDPIQENWETSCGMEYIILEGGPEDNGMVYCMYCGGLLKEC